MSARRDCSAMLLLQTPREFAGTEPDRRPESRRSVTACV